MKTTRVLSNEANKLMLDYVKLSRGYLESIERAAAALRDCMNDIEKLSRIDKELRKELTNEN